ncbi:hypothetical protein HZS_63 [Henneguya salminicola]|nr:hypothetical protein HZS_63 [Henneguya salminicola]
MNLLKLKKNQNYVQKKKNQFSNELESKKHTWGLKPDNEYKIIRKSRVRYNLIYHIFTLIFYLINTYNLICLF